MRSIAKLLTILWSVTLFVACSSSPDVVSNSWIQKRKYHKGFHTNIALHKSKQDKAKERLTPSPDLNMEHRKVSSAQAPNHPKQSELVLVQNTPSQTPVSVLKQIAPRFRVDSINSFAQLASTRSASRKIIAQSVESRLSQTFISHAYYNNGNAKTHASSIVGFIAALLGFFIAGIFLGTLAVSLGVVGIIKASSGEYKGMGLAIAAVVLGVVDIIGAILVIAGVI